MVHMMQHQFNPPSNYQVGSRRPSPEKQDVLIQRNLGFINKHVSGVIITTETSSMDSTSRPSSPNQKKSDEINQKQQLGAMLDKDPGLMEKREAIARRLELYKSARDEIDTVAWK